MTEISNHSEGNTEEVIGENAGLTKNQEAQLKFFPSRDRKVLPPTYTRQFREMMRQEDARDGRE